MKLHSKTSPVNVAFKLFQKNWLDSFPTQCATFGYWDLISKYPTVQLCVNNESLRLNKTNKSWEGGASDDSRSIWVQGEDRTHKSQTRLFQNEPFVLRVHLLHLFNKAEQISTPQLSCVKLLLCRETHREAQKSPFWWLHLQMVDSSWEKGISTFVAARNTWIFQYFARKKKKN